MKLRVSYGKSGNQAIDPNGTSYIDASVRTPYNGVSTCWRSKHQYHGEQ